MNIIEIEDWYKRINKLLGQNRMLDAFDKIATAFPINNYNEFTTQLEELRFTYSNMLNYTVQGVDDPLRNNIYKNLILSTYDLADRVKLDLLNQPALRLASMKNDLEKQMRLSREELADNLLDLSFDYELNEMLSSTALYEDESESESAIRHRKAIQRAFNFLWLNTKLSEDDLQVVGQIFESNSFPWYEKALLVSAVTLGLIRTYDSRRIELLVKLYAHDNPQISVRALVGILVSFSFYDKRLMLSSHMSDILLVLNDDQSFESDTFAVISQIIRSKDTDKIARKFREEIVPDIIKFNEDLSQKLNLENLLESSDEVDKNPDWANYFDDQPGLVRKLEDLTNMQMEGADVFLSAFAMLKNFPFFSEIHHWFMPFYRQHYAVAGSLRSEKESFRDTVLKGVENSPYMCNSDKFSFILNLKHMPERQKEIMAQMFTSEVEQFEELMSEELTDPALKKKRIVIQYIQDLYRFFKLNSVRTETGDIFQLPLDVHNTSVIGALISSPVFYRNIAGFYFDNNHFQEANRIYLQLLEKGENYAELYEKSGYCQQQTGNYAEAIAMYQKADLFDTNRKWLLGKMAQCYHKLMQPAKALEVYLELSQLEPDNMKVHASVGTCYLSLGDYSNALEYFYRIEFNEQGTARSMRPVAWCLFTLNRLMEAENYYTQLLEMEPNAFDFMNAGHVAFCLRNRQAAAVYYVQSILKRNGDLNSFLKAFIADKKFLLQNGVNSEDISLMLDFVRIRYQSAKG
ncbi:MAG: tetratricopeptide repeat protein [Lentimicrobium sp.]|nr:tetratricopeptide repeat protein [Lentimicrobium sp.]